MNKIDEIIMINKLKINTNDYLNKLKEKYKKDLVDFNYAKSINEIIQSKKIFIRYISVKGKLGYGGFYYKVIEENNKFYILLINKYKKVWKISFDDNFIFYKNILDENDNKREVFKDLLKRFT
jgi:hypothetical protein